MRKLLILLTLALACFLAVDAAAYRRTDKISENFKQLDLPPEEIDPDVAPVQKPQEVVDQDEEEEGTATGTLDSDIIEETEDAVPNVAENEILDSTGTAAPAPVAAAAAVESVTAAPAANAVAVETTPATIAAVDAGTTAEEEAGGLAKFCKCNENHCDCCREFNLPFIPIKGPGCARMTYLGNEKMSISLKYGDLTLASRTVSSKKARPICVGLPGGYSQFCGRVYGLSKAKENFKACLGFELRADDEVEAALRVSCFKFGPEGLRVAEAEPLPLEANKEEDEDDDDFFGFGAGGDDEDEEEEDYDEDDDEEEAEDDEADYADDDEEAAPADADYGGFSLANLLDELDDDDDDETKPSSTPAAASSSLTEATRNVVQSKDEKGTIAAAPAVPAVPSAATDSLIAAVSSVANVEAATSATPLASATTAKTKKTKKPKKNKKKKAVESESGFAYEILNGILDFFN